MGRKWCLITRRNAIGLVIGPFLGLLAFVANISVGAFTTDAFLAAVLLSVNSQFDPYFRSRGNLNVANIIALKINFFIYLLLTHLEVLDLSAIFYVVRQQPVSTAMFGFIGRITRSA